MRISKSNDVSSANDDPEKQLLTLSNHEADALFHAHILAMARPHSFFFLSPYSVLSAVIGEIDAALLAGIIAAKNAQIANETADSVSAGGS